MTEERNPSDDQAIIAVVAIVAGMLDALVVRSGDNSVTSSVVAGVVMAAFVFFALRWVRRRFPPRRRRGDATDAPPRGGWASPTTGQRVGRAVRAGRRQKGTGNVFTQGRRRRF